MRQAIGAALAEGDAGAAAPRADHGNPAGVSAGSSSARSSGIRTTLPRASGSRSSTIPPSTSSAWRAPGCSTSSAPKAGCSSSAPPSRSRPGCAPDWRYRYSVLRRGRVIAQSRGHLPHHARRRARWRHLLFCAISCSTAATDGVWEQFGKFVEDAKPHFVLMMGDQLYIDEDAPDVFKDHFESKRAVRRAALAEKYRLQLVARAGARSVLANVPMYMMWDDHDIRDGWGSLASDSPTLVAKYPARRRDLREVRTPTSRTARDVVLALPGLPQPAARATLDPALPELHRRPAAGRAARAMPFAFRCGRLVVLVLDSRGDRDVFRDRRSRSSAPSNGGSSSRSSPTCRRTSRRSPS